MQNSVARKIFNWIVLGELKNKNKNLETCPCGFLSKYCIVMLKYLRLFILFLSSNNMCEQFNSEKFDMNWTEN